MGADPWPGDDAGSLLHDLVVHGADLGTPGLTNLGDAIPALGSSGIRASGITRLLLSGPPDSSSPLID
jgi:hypothetical protein